MIQYVRNCPTCDEEILYKSKYTKKYAERDNKLCLSCSMTGKKRSLETKEKISNTLINFFSDEENRKNRSKSLKKKYDEDEGYRIKLIKAKLGENNPSYGKRGKDSYIYGIKNPTKQLGVRNKIRKTITEKWKGAEYRKKCIKSRLAFLDKIRKRSGQISPNYNPNSISILEAKAKELNITDLQHAENGGEYYIKELGYWVDGYSEEKNIVIEYYEPFHKRQQERDSMRKNEIMGFLNCDFIEILGYC